jgi:protein tyrosine/serine phosphatase
MQRLTGKRGRMLFRSRRTHPMFATMIARLGQAFKSWEVALRTSWGDDISTPALRRQALWHFHLFDHAWLRKVWTNFAEVAPGVYRSNQPDHARLCRLRDMGICTIVNLRGTPRQSHYLFEEESCRALGLTMVNLQLHARRPARRTELLALIETFRTAEKPLLIHCKSGADRAGLAAAIYLIAFEGRPVAEARRHLGLRYVHLKWTKTGICDHLLDVYEARAAASPIGFEDWIATEYDRDALAASFAAKRGGRPPPKDADIEESGI